MQALFRFLARFLIGVSLLGLVLCVALVALHFIRPNRFDYVGQCSLIALVFGGGSCMVILQLFGFEDFSQKEARKLMYVGVPKRIRVAGYAMMAAGAVLFFLPVLRGHRSDKSDFGDPQSSLSLIGFETIVATSGAMLGYSFLHFREVLAGRRCPSGHPVSPTALFCETCGATVV
jgi:hypothetical protein